METSGSIRARSWVCFVHFCILATRRVPGTVQVTICYQ